MPAPFVPRLLVAAVFAVLAAASADARRLPAHKLPQQWEQLRSGSPDRTESVERISRFRQARESLPEQARHGHLRLGPKLPSILERSDLERRAGFYRGAPDTVVLKIAVIRVEFDTDRMGDETTGDGRFMQVNPDPDKYFIDPAPHDDAYFAAHVEAVSRYWQSMTYGNVRIEGEVFPRGEQFGAYRLSDLADYGPESEDELFNIDGLVRYSRESLLAADADPDLVWSDFDIYFVVHAGSDWQNDVFQDSRFDLPTFSIAFSDSEVVVADEGDTLRTMITYPETSSQDGFLVGLNGGIAHEMGHQLGLWDIYNVETFAPTVAYYSVMDSGNLASVFVPNPVTQEETEVIGVLPTCVGAWQRWLVTFNFGIDPPLIKTDFPRLRLRAIQSRAEPADLGARGRKWFRVPISDTEYYLVENRVDDLDGRFPDGSFNTALDQDDATGVILGPVVADTPPDSTVISDNYDLLIDPGVLIWHIDERQALANLTQGRGLNVEFEKRSVTIEEADGFVDIGNPFSLHPIGTAFEAWWAGNASHFGPNTRPNSDSNLGTPTGISITDIGPRDSVVVMDVAQGAKPAGWPMEIGPYGSTWRTSTLIADVDGDGVSEVVAAGDSTLHVFRYQDYDGDGEVDIPGSWPAPSGGGALFGTPLYTQTVGDFLGNDSLSVVCVTDSGAIAVFEPSGSPWAGADAAGTLLQFPAGGFPTWSAMPADIDGNGLDELYVVTADGMLRGYNVNSPGGAVERFNARPILGSEADSVSNLYATLGCADVNGDGRLEGYLAYVRADSLFLQRFSDDGFRLFRIGHPLPEGVTEREIDRVWLSFGDLDRAGGGGLEVVVTTESGLVTVLDDVLEPMPGWPVVLKEKPISGPAALGELDGDGLLEIAVSCGLRTVHAFNYNGIEMAGWPKHVDLVDYPLPAQAPSTPSIADADGDGRQDVIVGFTDFTIHAISSDGDDAEGFPIPAGAATAGSPAVLDANGDGRLDMFLQSGDGKVMAHVLAGSASSTNPQWPMFAGGPRLHGAFDASRMPVTGFASGRVLDGPAVVYPNPVRNRDGQVHVRYTLEPGLASATQVSVTVYNTAGEKVFTRSGSAFENAENEVVFDVGELSSGVYFCTVRARSGANVESSQTKFAVLR